MIKELILNVTCDYCDKKTDLDKLLNYCNECHENSLYEYFKEVLTKVYKEHKGYDNRKGFTGFKTEEDKTTYLQGMKYGFLHALFWVCSEYGGDGLIFFWEKLAEKDWK